MKVLLITGGNSSERPVSLNSAKNVKKALTENGHKVKVYDLKDGYLPIKKLSKEYDVLFPILHGEEGEGGQLHKFLSKINRPIVGTRNYKGLASIWYKIQFKKFCDENKITTSPWERIKNKSDINRFGFPCVVKTSSGGSSLEVFILKTKSDLTKNKKQIFSHSDLFAELFIEGTEITVGVLNGKPLSVMEIIPPQNGWFSYKNKYSSRTQEIPDAPSVDEKTKKLSQKIALRIHKHFNLGTYSRTDFIVGQDDKLYALEINTIPGLTEGSLIPKEAKAAGLNFNQFIETLLKSAK